MINTAAMLIYGKNLENLLLQNQYTHDLETLYVASCMWVLGLGTGQFFRYDIRIDTNWSILDISFDTCVKDCYIWNICKIFAVMGQYCHLLYFPHYIIIYVFLKLKLTIPLRLCVFFRNSTVKENVETARSKRNLKWHKSVRTGSNMSCCFIIVINGR